VDKEKKYSVLIVDDENSNVLELTYILSPDYAIFTAEDGQKVLEAAEKHLPDVILLDVIMPEKDGYDILKELKRFEKTKDIPVIFMAEPDNTDSEEKGLVLGAADYINKPFSPAIVKLRVRNQIKMINQMRLITDREAAEKNSRARSEFLSRMRHEMRTPMNAIMGMTNLARNTVESEKRDEMLDEISSASEHLLKLIDDVLDMSDIEEGKLLLTLDDFSFADMIRNLLNTVNPDIRKKHQTLTTNIDPSIPDIVIGDEKRISQVMLKLLSNAGKFTPEQGSIQINAFVCEVDSETLTMQVEVIDNGPGISLEHQQKLFIPNDQADGVVNGENGGTGLSLTISKHIALLMGGDLWVISEPGKGSIFAFTMKVQLKTPEAKSTDSSSMEGKTVLLVDDFEINREIVISMLENTGLKIECAENGREALGLFTSDPEKFDIILMDVNMPEMDGVEATRRIRALDNPKGKSVPIIAMTANVLMSEVDTYIEAGMNDHIGKPVDFDKLFNQLTRFLTN